LCASRKTLSLDVLAEVAGWSYDEKERFARETRQLLRVAPEATTALVWSRLRQAGWSENQLNEQVAVPSGGPSCEREA